MHIESNYYCPLVQSLFIGDSSLLRLMADTFEIPRVSEESPTTVKNLLLITNTHIK